VCRVVAALGLGLGLGLVAGVAVDRLAPAPVADVGRGSEDAFVTGLHERERAPDGTPMRWTTGQAEARFVHLPPGPARLEVVLQGHRSPIRVAVGGAVVGVLQAGERSLDVPVTVGPSRRIEVLVASDPFRAGDGRLLGTKWRRVAVLPQGRAWPALSLLGVFVLPAVLLMAAALWVGMKPLVGASLTIALVALEGLLLTPFGLVRSAYAWELAGLLAGGALVSGAFGRFAARWRSDAAPWGFVAALAAFLLHCVLSTSPVMVASDVVYQAHNLDRVAGGDLFPTTPTQHTTPFRIPYGVSFFALLAPLRLAGVASLALVRWGAGVAGLVASLALFGLLAARSPARAALTVVVLQLLPGTFIIYSQGNLPNAFAQAVTTLFLVWWAESARGGWWIGGLLFAVAAIGHLSGAIVLVAWAAALLLIAWRDARDEGRRRLKALGLGLALTALYYAQFSYLIVRQIPRMLEGGGQGGGAGLIETLQRQGAGVLEWWGWPAVLLGLMGLPRLRAGRLDRSLVAFWAAGALLLVAAAATPVEVRYLHALTLPVAIAVGAGCADLARRGRRVAAFCVALLVAQAILVVKIIVERLLAHYR
jgi:hypothetical protein